MGEQPIPESTDGVAKAIVDAAYVDSLLPVHQAQVLTYLKLTGHRLGLLINFNVPVIRHGVKRIAL